jgi:molybdate transport system substrate-binding protein
MSQKDYIMAKSRFRPLLAQVTVFLAMSAVMADVAGAAGAAQADHVDVFAAGSLRGVVSALAKEAGPALNIEVNASFGGSGTMRERIEKGEKADLLLSADLGSPRKLESQGRTVVPTIAFARNRLCVISRKSAGVTAANFVDRMLTPQARLKTSTPIVDPAGDYAWALFDEIDRMRPGAAATLKGKAQSVTNAVAALAPESQGAVALFSSKQIDMSITYCSGSAAMEKDMPELASLEVPAPLDPHPIYGIAVLTANPAAMRLALFLLSDKGHEIIARENLIPLLEPRR